jgi:hypothetical protein
MTLLTHAEATGNVLVQLTCAAKRIIYLQYIFLLENIRRGCLCDWARFDWRSARQGSPRWLRHMLFASMFLFVLATFPYRVKSSGRRLDSSQRLPLTAMVGLTGFRSDFIGSAPQMSRAYWLIARSDENCPLWHMLVTTMLSHILYDR